MDKKKLDWMKGPEEDFEEDFEEELSLKDFNLEDKNKLEAKIKELKTNLDSQVKYTTKVQDELQIEKEKNHEAILLRLQAISFITDSYVRSFRHCKATQNDLQNGTGYDRDDIENMECAISSAFAYQRALTEISDLLKLNITFPR